MVNINKNLLYMTMFFLMSLICAFFSSSTPDNISVAEIIIGLFLIILVGTRGLLVLFNFERKQKSGLYVPNYVRISMLFLIIVPTIVGILISHNGMNNYIRDIIPLLYIYLPVLLLHHIKRDSKSWLNTVVLSLCAIGIVYSIRHFTEGGGSISNVGKEYIWGGNSDNIAQDPATLFVLSFFSAGAAWYFGLGRVSFGFFFFLLAMIPWATIIASILRAPVVLTIIVILLSLVHALKQSGRQIPLLFTLLVIIFPLFYFYGDVIIDFSDEVLGLLLDKHHQVGLSSRDLEVIAVFNNVDSVFVLLFGEGWGGLIDGPFSSTGGWRFVHNMFLYIFFKAGLLGTLALLLYMGWFFSMIVKIFKKLNGLYYLICISLIVPLFISMMLEPMFKSLTFGLVLLIIPLLMINQSKTKIVGL